MNGSSGYYTKWSQTKTNTNTVWSHVHVKSEKKKDETKAVGTERRLMVARGSG